MSKLIRTKQALDQAVTALFEHAPFLYPLYELTGPLPLRHHKPGFIGLARMIVSQQVLVASARAIWARVAARYPALSADDILGASDEDLRACGLSAPKMRTVRAMPTPFPQAIWRFRRVCAWPMNWRHAPPLRSLRPMPRIGGPIGALSRNCYGPITGS